MNRAAAHDALFQAFDALCDLDEDAQAREVERLRGEDPELAAAVFELLARDARSNDTHGMTAAVWRSAEEAMAPDRSGERIGRFTLLERLGQGGMGVVYSAFDAQLERRVAVKLIRSETPDEHARARLVREARAMAKLAHPNVVPVFEVGTVGDDVFIAMEYVRGSTLREWVSAETRPWQAIVDAYRDAGAGLAAAHEVSIVHRDFKPDNVIVGEDGRARVLDFGVARTGALPTPQGSHSERDAAQQLTQTGAMAGTPAYMAPEQFRLGEVDARTDQFAFCVALREALLGERPFVGDTPELLRQAVLAGERTAWPAGSGVPNAVRQAIERGLSVDPDARWPTMAALLAALERGRAPWQRALLPSLGLGTVALVVGLAWTEEAEKPCQDGAGRFASTWGDEARAAVGEALRSAAPAYGAATADAVTRELDRYATVWVEGYTDACEATRIRGDQSSELMDLRMRCLDRHRRALAATVDVLAEADAELAEHAIDVVAKLDTPLRCADADYVSAQLPPPSDPAVAKAVEAQNDALAEARALQHSGKFDQARTVANDVIDANLDHPPLEADARARRGSLLADLGHYDDAVADLRRAYFVAYAAGADERAASAAAELVSVLGIELRKHDNGLEWLEHAQAALSRTHGEGTSAQARLLSAHAGLEHARGEYENSLKLYRRAGELRRDLLPAEHVDHRIDLFGIASNLIVLGRADEALEPLNEALELLEGLLGPDHPAVAEALTNIGRAHRARGKLDDALASHERALQIRRATLAPDHPYLALSLNNLANVQYQRADFEQAARLHSEALKIRRARLGAQHADVASSLANLGAAELALGHNARALELMQDSLEIRERALGSEHPDVAAALSNITGIQVMMGENLAALESGEQARKAWIGALGPEHPNVATAITNLALAKENLGDLEGALADHQRARAILSEALGPEHSRLAETHTNIGNVLRELGRLDESAVAHEAARVAAVASGGPDHPNVATAEYGLGQVDEARGDRTSARARYLRAHEIWTHALGAEHPQLATSLEALGAVDLAEGNAKDAVRHYTSALEILTGAELPDADTAQCRFGLARALWASGRDRGRAFALAKAAAAALPNGKNAEIHRWLARNGH